MAPPQKAAPLLAAALRCRCPRCGQGRLYRGLLTVQDNCPICGLDLRGVDTGDGPAVLVMFFLCIVVIGGAIWLELAFAPPLWVHAVVWPPVTLALALLIMRPAKAAMIAVQYRTRADEMGL